jgi:hypothetical protein
MRGSRVVNRTPDRILASSGAASVFTPGRLTLSTEREKTVKLKTTRIALSAIVLLAGSSAALATTSTMRGEATPLRTDDLGYAISGMSAGGSFAGALAHHFWNASDSTMARFTDGQSLSVENNANENALRTVYTFCMDQRSYHEDRQTYTYQRVTDAPIPVNGNPDGAVPYTVDQERRLNAIMLASRNMGFVDNRGFFNNAQYGNDHGAAIALLVWESVWDETPASHSAGSQVWDIAGNQMGDGQWRVSNYTSNVNATVRGIIDTIRTAAYSLYTNNLTPILVRSITTNVNGNGQDQVVLDLPPAPVIVPLPPAAWAGLGTLASLFACQRIRRRRAAEAV